MSTTRRRIGAATAAIGLALLGPLATGGSPATAQTTTTAPATLQVTLTADRPSASIGEQIVFTAIVTNQPSGTAVTTGQVLFEGKADDGRGGSGSVVDVDSDGRATMTLDVVDEGYGYDVIAYYDTEGDWNDAESNPVHVRFGAATDEPVGATEELVAQLYEHLFDHAPSRADLDYWSDQIERRGATAVADTLAKTRPARAAVVSFTYFAMFGRGPTADESAYWVDELVAGRVTGEGLRAQLFSALTVPERTLGALYQGHLLSFAPGPADRDYWLPRLDTAAERKHASLNTTRSVDGVNGIVRYSHDRICPSAPRPAGADLAAISAFVKATGYDIARVGARLQVTYCLTATPTP